MFANATRHSKLIIIQVPACRYTAAVYTARANLNPVLITVEVGGQLTTTTEVENWRGPGRSDQPVLMERMQVHAENLRPKSSMTTSLTWDFSKRPFTLTGENTYTCDALIIATGASACYIGLPSEEAFKGRGVVRSVPPATAFSTVTRSRSGRRR